MGTWWEEEGSKWRWEEDMCMRKGQVTRMYLTHVRNYQSKLIFKCQRWELQVYPNLQWVFSQQKERERRREEEEEQGAGGGDSVLILTPTWIVLGLTSHISDHAALCHISPYKTHVLRRSSKRELHPLPHCSVHLCLHLLKRVGVALCLSRSPS